MGYVRTGGMSTAARRRRRRTALVLAALSVALLLVLAYAVAYYQGGLPGSGDTSADADQATATAPALAPGDVGVNVYNATGEPGLAGRTAEKLEERGFRIASIDNDPENASIEHSADIRFGPEGEDAAELVQEFVPGSELAPDEREDAVVDLVLGDGFEALAEETSSPEPTGG